MPTELDTMQDVVAWLKLTRAGALLELEEFEQAINEICATAFALGETIPTQRHELADLAGDTAMSANGETTLHSRARATSIAQLVVALAELQRGVRGWGIGGT